MDYCFTIDKFSGPLDLLLHLIKQSNINIYDIEIEKIAEEYLNYIKKMQDLNLNIASSYLVMAAELIEIKASLLLPKPKIEEDTYEESPKDNLIKRLIEYQNYKDLTNKFQELEYERHQYYTKKASDISEYDTKGTLDENLDLEGLLKTFEKFLLKKEETKPLKTKITKKEYSVQKRTEEIKKIIKEKGNVEFQELFTIYTKPYIIVTFMAILVLAKNKEILINQENNFDNIILNEVNQ